MAVFQSTHPRGVRHSSLNMAATASDFNPRTHVGCDLDDVRAEDVGQRNFNPRTHVGCDSSTARTWRWGCYFNPRTHVGCDADGVSALSLRQRFQSTHPRGVRPASCWPSNSSFRHFNPRTHVGCDDARTTALVLAHEISIHAPTWGATSSGASVSRGWIISIHAPTWGATNWLTKTGKRLYFNPRTHVGCDFPMEILMRSTIDFNPRTHVGCDPRS